MKTRTPRTARGAVTGASSKGETTLVLGSGPLAREVIRAIIEHGAGEYVLLGAIAESGADRLDVEAIGCRVLGFVDRLETILVEHRPERIVLAITDGKLDVMERLLIFLLHSDAELSSTVEFYESLTGQVPINALTPLDLLFGHGIRPRPIPVHLNRLLSLLFGAMGVILTLPLMGLIALAVKINSEGPAIFVQQRSGLGGRRFGLFKFRTMRVDTSQRSVWAAENSDRITGVGRVLRKFRLDELPQFFNILKGDMNLVGPRPHPSPSCELMELISRNASECGMAVPYYTIRSMVRPGITGWAQVRYKYANGLGEEMEKLRYDLYYIKNYSVWLDMRILVMTLVVVLRGAGNGDSSSAQPVRVPHRVPRLPPMPRDPESDGEVNGGRIETGGRSVLELRPGERRGAGE